MKTICARVAMSSLGIFHCDCGNQDLVQQALEAIIPQAQWPEINARSGSLLQLPRGSRGREARRKLLDTAESVGPAAPTMLELLDSAKKLVGMELLKKMLSSNWQVGSCCLHCNVETLFNCARCPRNGWGQSATVPCCLVDFLDSMDVKQLWQWQPIQGRAPCQLQPWT